MLQEHENVDCSKLNIYCTITMAAGGTTRQVDQNILFHTEPRWPYLKDASMKEYTQSWPTEPPALLKTVIKAVEPEKGQMVAIPEGPFYISTKGLPLRNVKIEAIEPRRRDRLSVGGGFLYSGDAETKALFQRKDNDSVEWVTYKHVKSKTVRPETVIAAPQGRGMSQTQGAAPAQSDAVTGDVLTNAVRRKHGDDGRAEGDSGYPG